MTSGKCLRWGYPSAIVTVSHTRVVPEKTGGGSPIPLMAPAAGPGLPYIAVAEKLSSAWTRRELIAAAQRIQHVACISLREALGRIVKRRLEEFKK